MSDVANSIMAAEVITAVVHPSYWQPHYITILPEQLLENIVEPLYYFVGIISCNMKWIDKSVVFDAALIDLDNCLSTPYHFDGGCISFNRHLFGLYQ